MAITKVKEVTHDSVILALTANLGTFLYVERNGSVVTRRDKIQASSQEHQSFGLELNLEEMGFKNEFFGQPQALKGFAQHVCAEINRILPTDYIQDQKYSTTIYKWGTPYDSNGGN